MRTEETIGVLAKSPLFHSIPTTEIMSFLSCLHAETKAYGRYSTIFSAGEPARMGIVLSGELRIQTEDMDGHISVLTVLGAPDLFGEVFALSGSPSSVSAYSEDGCEVIFFDISCLTAVCGKACSFHREFLWNLLHTVARKTEALNRKIFCISRRTTRDKIEAFLLLYREKSGSDIFTVPLNRSEMADYLCVERSALSAVLSQMQKDRQISYHRNSFRILPNTKNN